MGRVAETREEWLARKKAKPTFGKLHNGTIKPQCGCGICDHELSWDCDPNGGMADSDFGCLCCDETCS